MMEHRGEAGRERSMESTGPCSYCWATVIVLTLNINGNELSPILARSFFCNLVSGISSGGGGYTCTVLLHLKANAGFQVERIF